MEIKIDRFRKAGKLVSIAITIMLVATAFIVINVGSTDVGSSTSPSAYVKASQTYVEVMNFTIITQSDTLLAGAAVSVAEDLSSDGEASDWGIVRCYDADSGSGGWNPATDSIWLDNLNPNRQYETNEIVLAGITPPTGAAGYSNDGCKMYAWKRIKTNDSSNGDAWDSSVDSIVYEGTDNNTVWMDQLNAVTFNMSASCNATSSDIDDLTFWLDAGSSGFDNSEDTFLGNATYSTDSYSWNISGLTRDINTSATFFVAVNISSGASHWHTIKMEIPTKVDSGSSGSYDNDDQGLFLAGTNDTGGITNSNTQTIDTNVPETDVDDITGYWKKATDNPLAVPVTATDSPSGVATVALYYYYCADNSTWVGYSQYGSTNTTPWVESSWPFDFNNGSGYYRFYSIGVDNASNTETAPDDNDTLCGYDASEPGSIITAPADSANLNSLTNITGTVSDTFSDVASVAITIYNSSDGAYWTGVEWGSSTNLNANLSADYDNWWFEDTSEFPTWVSGKSYIINSTATDNATNVESTADSDNSHTFNYDDTPPTVDSITLPQNSSNYNNATLTNITGTASDSGGSELSSINITVYNQTGGKYWNGTDWASSALVWLETNGTANWYNDSALPTWTNDSTYYVNATPTDAAGNVGGKTWVSFFFDDNGVWSEATDISTYWNTNGTQNINFTAGDPGSGLANVTLYYRYASDNETWGSWTNFSDPDTDPWDATAWTFNFPSGVGYYEFYTRATDNASNTEDAPAGDGNDTICGYDPNAPTGTIVLPADSAYYKSGDLIESKINGTLNDPRNVTNAYIEIRNNTGNAYFDGSTWGAGYTNLTVNITGTAPSLEWVYDNTSAYPTWLHNQTYYVNLSARDTAGNWNNSTASASFLYDDQGPIADVVAPINATYYSTLTNITGTASDDGSGVATVNITIYNQTGAKYWNGTDWGSDDLVWLDTTGTTTRWYYDTAFPSWTNGSTYLINATATDNAGNVGGVYWNNFTYDNNSITSEATDITTYWQTSSSVSIDFEATDYGSGLHNVSLYYRYSSTNASGSWGSWTYSANDTTPWDPTTFDFSFPSAGFYEFYTIATDNSTPRNTEDAPADNGNDTICGYDDTNPFVNITSFTNNSYYTSMDYIAGDCSDSGTSGVKEVNITIYNVSGNTYWTGSAWDAAVNWSSTTLSSGNTIWNYTSGSSVTWEDNVSYIINATTTDNASRTSTADSKTFTIDTTAPTVVVEMNSGDYVKQGDTVKVFANFTEDGSGIDHSTVLVSVDTTGTDVSSVAMNATDNTHWWYNWDVPSGSDGTANVSVAASDNVSYSVTGSDTYNTTKTIDNTAPTVEIAYGISRNYYRDADTVIIYANFTENGAGITHNPQISINYSGSGDDLSAQDLTKTNNTDWYYSLNVPSGSDGNFTVNITATDNASNNLNPNPTTDDSKYVDNTDPTGNIAIPTDDGYYDETLLSISGVVNDTYSLSSTVTITIYNQTGNTNFTGSTWADTSASLTANTSGSGTQISWLYDNTSAYPTFTDGSNYTVNLTATDTAGNSAQVDSNTFHYDSGGPTISDVVITSINTGSTSYIKHGHTFNITATVTDSNLASGNTQYIKADLTALNGSADAQADGYDGTTAYWNSTVTTYANTTITVTINASDQASNYATEVEATIIQDDTPPTISYVVMDADNDGTNYSYIDIYFSETTMNHSTIAYTDFNVSTTGVDTAEVITSSGNLVTLKLDSTIQTGDSPTLGVDGSVEDLAGNTLTSGTTLIETFNISLSAGLNLVSFPCDVSTEALTTVLTDLTGTWTIYRYNATLNTWQYYNPSTGYYPTDVQWNLTGGEGYWVSLGTAQNLVGNYDLWPDPGHSMPSYTLKGQSWNLIGHWQTYNQTASTNYGGALASLSDSDAGSLWRYNSGGGYTNILNGAQNMEPCKGYWLWKESSGDKQYTPS